MTLLVHPTEVPAQILPAGRLTGEGQHRRVTCRWCDWSAPAPGTGFARAAQLLRDHLTERAGR